MRGVYREDSPLDAGEYLSLQSNLRRLERQLPADKVQCLACEVIRRLTEHQEVVTVEAPSSNEIEALCLALIAEDDEAGAQWIKGVRLGGASVQSIYLQYLAAAARRLGDWWESDRVSFVDVTLGTSRMYAIMGAISDRFPVPMGFCERCAIFASVPGEAHTLGVRMAADLFRNEGWEIDLKLCETHEQLVTEIANSTYGILGLSAAGNHALPALSKVVVATRLRMPEKAIFVSGQIVEEDEGALALMDIDGTAKDIEGARKLLTRLSERQSART